MLALQDFVFNKLQGTRPNGTTTSLPPDATKATYNTSRKHLFSGFTNESPDLIITPDLFIATNGKGSYAVGDHVIDDTTTPVMRGVITKMDKGLVYVTKSNTAGESVYLANGTYYPQDTLPRIKVVDAPTIIANKPTSETPVKKQHRLRPFDRDGSLNIRGMFHQLVKHPEIQDTRPFVLAELAREKHKIHSYVSRITIVPSYWLYDIKMAHISASIKTIGLLDNAKDITPQQALDYYTYCSMIGKSTDYSWLAPYLTHANMLASKPVVIFHSKHRHIELANGYISYTEHGSTYTVPVQYDSDANRFYF